jgi:hypothetical protein
LDVLLRLSGQEARIKQNHFGLWNAVAVWKAESRYNVVGTAQQPDAAASRTATGDLVTGRELSEKFRELESRIAEEKGGFALFALFMREDAPDRWDLIVSAPWVGSDKRNAVDYFVTQIKSRLGERDLTNLARIVVVDPHDAAVEALNRAVQIEHGGVEVRDSNFFGLPVKQAFIITSRRPPAPAAA